MENHLHVNILPENYEEYEAGIQLIRRWASQVSEHQGKVVGEHGTGQTEVEILDGFVPERYTGLCKELKGRLDKDSLGTMEIYLKKRRLPYEDRSMHEAGASGLRREYGS